MKIKQGVFILLCAVLFKSHYVFSAPEKIYLFRHSEKLAGKDPELTQQGNKRAQHLVSLFKQYDRVHVFSSNYKRTLQTAAPLAAHFDSQIQIYNARDLVDLKNQIVLLEGVVAVIGHSNTTPDLAVLLSNEEVAPMNEMQFSRYFLLSQKEHSSEIKYLLEDLEMNFTFEYSGLNKL